MGDSPENQQGRTVVGGRHGSPTVTVAMPFSKVTSVDSEVRDSLAELAKLVARLASADKADREAIAAAAEELAERLGSG